MTYSNSLGTYEDVKRIIDSMSDVLHWYRLFPNSFFLVSEKTATQLSSQIKGKASGRFLIADMDTDRNGWMPKKAWEFIKNPKAVGDE